MIFVKSSNIAALGFEPERKVMTVQFNSGTKYEYSNVEEDLFQEILTAESVGRAFDKLVKSQPIKYPYAKVV